MSRIVVMLCTVGLLIGMSMPAWSQDTMGQEQVLEALATQIKSVLHADNVLGTPRDFDGMQVVPIIGLFFGFGSGSGMETEDEGQGRGVGMGGGGGVWPTGLLIITEDGEIRVMPATKTGLGELLKDVVPMVMQSLQSRDNKQDDKQQPQQ